LSPSVTAGGDVTLAKRLTKKALERFGYEVHRLDAAPDQRSFRARASSTIDRHLRQTRDDVAALNAKYREPVFGEVRIWELFPILARCIDPADAELGCTSQLTHTLQVVEAMRDDGVSDPDLLLCGLIHDLGKVLLAGPEDPANVIGWNGPIGSFEAGAGFDNCVFQWNHDEFAFTRFRDHVPDHVAWLIRYHSVGMDLPEIRRLMDERDRLYAAQYYEPFRRYDGGSKSAWYVPQTRIEDHRALIERVFPGTIPF
jgi:hypothetical protein